MPVEACVDSSASDPDTRLSIGPPGASHGTDTGNQGTPGLIETAVSVVRQVRTFCDSVHRRLHQQPHQFVSNADLCLSMATA